MDDIDSAESDWLFVDEQAVLSGQGLSVVSECSLLGLVASASVSSDSVAQGTDDHGLGDSFARLQPLLAVHCADKADRFPLVVRVRSEAVMAHWSALLRAQKRLWKRRNSFIADGERASTGSSPPDTFNQFMVRFSLSVINRDRRLDDVLEICRHIYSSLSALASSELGFRCPSSSAWGEIVGLLAQYFQQDRYAVAPAMDAQQRCVLLRSLALLACGKRTVQLLLNFVALLYRCADGEMRLPLRELVSRLDNYPQARKRREAELTCDSFVATWKWNDGVQDIDPPAFGGGAGVVQGMRQVACDGTFLYTTTRRGQGLVKLGTGLHGSMRSHTYASRPDVAYGAPLCVAGHLLHVKLPEGDNDNDTSAFDFNDRYRDFAARLDPDLLQAIGGVDLCMPSTGGGEAAATLHTNATLRFISDGAHALWIWARDPDDSPPSAPGGQSAAATAGKSRSKPLEIFVRKLALVCGENDKWTLVPVTTPQLLHLPVATDQSMWVDSSGDGVDISDDTLSGGDGKACYFCLPSSPWAKVLKNQPVFTNGNTLSILLPTVMVCASAKTESNVCTMQVTVSMDTGRLLSVGRVGVNAQSFNTGLDYAAAFDARNNCVWTMRQRTVDQWSHLGCPATDAGAILLRNPAGAGGAQEPTASPEGDVSVSQLRRAILDYLQRVIPDQMSHGRAFEWLHVPQSEQLVPQERRLSEFGSNVLELFGERLDVFFADLENPDVAMADTFLSLTRAYGCCPVELRDEQCTARIRALLERFAELHHANDQLSALRRIAIDTLWSHAGTFYPRAAQRTDALRTALRLRLAVVRSANEAGDRVPDDDAAYACAMRELRLDLSRTLGCPARQLGEALDEAPTPTPLGSLVQSDLELVQLLFSISVESAIGAVRRVQHVPADDLRKACRHEPMVPESTRVLVSLLRNTMCAFLPLDNDKSGPPMTATEPTGEQWKGPTVLMEKVYSSCLEVLREAHTCMERMRGDARFADRCSLVRCRLLASAVGHVAPLLTSVLSHRSLQSAAWSDAVLATVGTGPLLELHKLCGDIAAMNGPAKARKAVPGLGLASGQDAVNASILSILPFSEPSLEPEPFLAELALSLMEMLLLHISCLFCSAPVAKAEAEHARLYLQSAALKRCVWSQPSLVAVVSGETLDSDAAWCRNMKVMRTLAGKVLPLMRPSVVKLLDVANLDTLLFRVFARHFRLKSHIKTWSRTKVCPAVLAEALRIVFGKINDLFRKIQAIAEMESSLATEVCEYSKGNEMFFHRFQHDEGGLKQLRMLCSIVKIPFDANTDAKDIIEQLEILVATRHAFERLEEEEEEEEDRQQRKLPVTELIPGRISKCCEVLLCIPLVNDCTVMDFFDKKDASRASGKETGPDFWRSASAPMSGQRVPAELLLSPSRTLRKSESLNRSDDIAVAKATMQEFIAMTTKNTDELMAIISDSALGDYQADCKGLHELLECRAAREQSRKTSLAYMTSLVDCSTPAGAGSQLVSKIIRLLRCGPRYGQLISTAGISAVRQNFGRLLKSLVQLLSQEEGVNSMSAALLCSIPFVREDAEILVSSGLLDLCATVFLSDRFGGLSAQSPAAAVWIGFQMLVHRVLSWNVLEDSYSSPCKRVACVIGDVIAGLLGRAPHLRDEVSYGALNSVLELLLAFSKNGMGRIILSQPNCVTKLLSLLCDHRPSPNLVLMVLQLCRVALPLMSMSDCQAIRLPTSLNLATSEGAVDSSPSSLIVMLLLFKLGDYIVPSAPYTVESPERAPCRRPSDTVEGVAAALAASLSSTPAPSSRAALYLHIQQSVVGQSTRQLHQFWEYFYLNRSEEMAAMSSPQLSHQEQAAEVTRHGRLLLLRGTHAQCIKVAADLAVGGFMLNVDLAGDSDGQTGSSEAKCLERNLELAESTSLRPFISGNAANIMAAEVIGLLHALMMTKDKEAAKFWLKAINEAFNKGLNATRHIVPLLATIANHIPAADAAAAASSAVATATATATDGGADGSERVAPSRRHASTTSVATCSLRSAMQPVRLAIAVLGALGGLAENIFAGTRVGVVAEGTHRGGGGAGIGTVRSVSDRHCSAVVDMDGDASTGGARVTIEVPLHRLNPPVSEPLPLETLNVTESFMNAAYTLLSVSLDADGMLPSALVAMETSDGDDDATALSPDQLPQQLQQLAANSAPRAAARLLAQLKTRASCALAYHVVTPLVYARVCADRVLCDRLTAAADICHAGLRLPVVEEHCNRLRMVYRDCSRPPPPRQHRRRSVAGARRARLARPARPVRFDLQLPRELVTCCVFSEAMTTLRRTSDAGSRSVGRSLAIGAPAVPKYAESYYFEVVCRDAGIVCPLDAAAECPFAFGFTTLASKDQATFAVGLDVRVIAQPETLPQEAIPLPLAVNCGDTFGIGWQFVEEKEEEEAEQEDPIAVALAEQMADGQAPPASPRKRRRLGQLYFTLNGEALEQQLNNVCIAQQHPYVEILRKDVTVHCNFGQEKFLYAAGEEARAAADACSSVVADIADIVAAFQELPFFEASVPGEEDQAATELALSGSASAFFTPENGPEAEAEARAPPGNVAAGVAATAAAAMAAAGQAGGDLLLACEGIDYALPEVWRGGAPARPALRSVSPANSFAEADAAVTPEEKVVYQPISPRHLCFKDWRPAMLHSGHSISSSAALGPAGLAREDWQEARQREAVAAAAAAEEDSAKRRSTATNAAPDVEAPSNDLNELLVASWEKKIFPTIRNRFRNNEERRQGLEQITGALRMGLIDIAIQTVQFLYEDGGGQPPNLQFPTLETVKADMNKFDINRVRKGGVVLIGPDDPEAAQDAAAVAADNTTPAFGRGGFGGGLPSPAIPAIPAATGTGAAGAKLPAFATPAMAATVGLVGTVTNVDKVNQLVEVEVYVREEGVLASFWYPASFLRRAPAEYHGANAMRSPEDMTTDVHKQLVCCESLLSDLHCRLAVIAMLSVQGSSPSTPPSTPTPAPSSPTSSTDGDVDAYADTTNLLEVNLWHLHPRRTQLPATAPPCEYAAATATAATSGTTTTHDDNGLRLLTLLSAHLLAAPNAEGVVPNGNLTQCSSPQRCLDTVRAPLPERLYANAEPLRAALRRFFGRKPAAWPAFAESVLAELRRGGRVRSVLLDCCSGERDYADVLLDGAAAIVVSCELSQDGDDDQAAAAAKTNQPSDTDKNTVYARIFAYDPQLGLRHNGRPQLREVVRYPNLIAPQPPPSPPTAHCGARFPTVIVPGDRVHVRIQGNAPLGRNGARYVVRLTSVPAALPLALLFVDEIVQAAFLDEEDTGASADAATHGLCVRVWLQCVEALLAFLRHTAYPPAIRECLLLRVSSLLVALCFSDWRHRHALDADVVHRLLRTLDNALVPMVAELAAFAKRHGVNRLNDVAAPPPGVAAEHCQLPDYARALLELLSAVPMVCSALGVDNGNGGLLRWMPGLHEISGFGNGKSPRKSGKASEPPPSPLRRALPWVDALLGAVDMILMHRSHADLPPPPPPPESAARRHFRRHFPIAVPRFLPTLPRQPVAKDAFSRRLALRRYLLVANISGELTVDEARAALRSLAKPHGGLRSLLVPSHAKAGEHVQVAMETETSVDRSPERQPCCGFAVLELRLVSAQADLAKAVQACRQLRATASPPPEAGGSAAGRAVTASSLEMEIEPLLAARCHDPAVQYLLLTALFDGAQLRPRAAAALRAMVREAAAAEAAVPTPGAVAPVAPPSIKAPPGMQQLLRRSSSEDSTTSPAVSKRFLFCATHLPMHRLVAACRPSMNTPEEFYTALFKERGRAPEVRVQSRKRKGSRSHVISVEPFVKFVAEKARSEPRLVWKGLMDAGYDFNFELMFREPSEQQKETATEWTSEMDAAIVRYGNHFAQDFGIPAKRLNCQDFVLSEAQMQSDDYSLLAECSRQEIVMRAEMLLRANTLMAPFLPVMDLRTAHTHMYSMGATLLTHRSRLFYSTKTEFLNAVLNASAIDKLDDLKRPEIWLNPLSKVGDGSGSLLTQFAQAAEQLVSTPSTQYQVPIASGGDPTYPFQVRFTGDDVQGTSGSFRHFLWTVAEELRSKDLSLLEECRSAASGLNKAKYIMSNRPISCPDERLLQFFGQLLGIVMRADLPLPLDLLPSFWKSFLLMELDMGDLKEADIVAYQYITDIANAKNEQALRIVLNPDAATDDDDVDDDSLLSAPSSGASAATTPTASSSRPGRGGDAEESEMAVDSRTETGDEDGSDEEESVVFCNSLGQVVTFACELADGGTYDLCPGGATRPLTFANRDEYVRLLRDQRLCALRSEERAGHVRAGFATVVPLHVLHVMAPHDMQLRICGRSAISLEFLKGHTSYQTGIDETNPHILLFWQALESFSEDELSRFIKFASNQERLPVTCPCQSNPTSQHVPPYPMKIGPADGDVTSNPDQRYLRAETCMFLVKLPLYSTLEVMRDKMLHAIHCRDDPLSG